MPTNWNGKFLFTYQLCGNLLIIRQIGGVWHESRLQFVLSTTFILSCKEVKIKVL